MAKNKDIVVMMILMRDDLASLNPGKAIIQGTHAANQCVGEMPEDKKPLYDEWTASTGRSFGTGISYQCGEDTMRKVVLMAKDAGLHADIMKDPEYPIRDGKITHHLPLDTCAYIFGRYSQCRAVLEEARQTVVKDEKGKPLELNWYP